MDGRWKRLIASGVLLSVVGCGHLREKRNNPPANTAEPPLSVTSLKPLPAPEEKRGKNDPIKVETLVALGNVRLQSAAMPDRSPTERDELCGEARKTFQSAVQREPKNVDAMLGMARTYKLSQDKAKCVEWYQQACKATPKNAGIWGEMGQALDSLKDHDGAIQCYHTATKMDPENKNYSKALGFALAYSGRYEEVLAWLNRCMSPANAHFNLARMMDHNGQKDRANQEYAQVLKLEPTNEQARMALNNTAPGSERMTDAGQVQMVNYEQVTPISNVVSPRTPAVVTPMTRDNRIPTTPMNIRQPDPLPMNVLQPGNASPSNGWDPIRK